jgi:phage recombination protein Bet
MALWTDEEKNLIKSQIAPGATDNELRLFQAQCQRTGLDPFSRQIYAIMREQWDAASRQKVKKMTIQTSIDGFRVIAQRSGKYAGQDGPYWCGPDGEWKDVWLSDELPAAAKVLVYNRDFDRPIIGIALFAEYAAKKQDGTLLGLWKKGEKPTVMIAKCAEALAFRKAFPNDLSGLYTAEEMSQADVKVLDQEPVALPEAQPVATRGRRRAAAAAAPEPTPQPAAEPAQPPEPEVIDAETVEAPAAPAQAAPEAAQPAPAPAESPALASLRQRIEMLSQVGFQALLIAYSAIPDFAEVRTVDGFLDICAAQPEPHLAGLKEENIAKLNQGLHPRTGAVLVQPAAPANDPAQPFG